MAHPAEELMLLTAALMLGSARAIACLGLIPAFSQATTTRLIRTAIAICVSLPATVFIAHSLSVVPSWSTLAVLGIKEAVVGAMLGTLLATPFWAMQSAGALIDNQRGANAAQLANPMLKTDASPLGDLLQRMLVISLMEAGVFMALFDVLYDSFRFWPAMAALPGHGLDQSLFIGAFSSILSDGMRYAAPVLLALLTIELCFGVAGVAIQGMPVGELAMPVKSLTAMFILVLYLSGLMDTAASDVSQWFTRLHETAAARTGG